MRGSLDAVPLHIRPTLDWLRAAAPDVTSLLPRILNFPLQDRGDHNDHSDHVPQDAFLREPLRMGASPQEKNEPRYR